MDQVKLKNWCWKRWNSEIRSKGCQLLRMGISQRSCISFLSRPCWSNCPTWIQMTTTYVSGYLTLQRIWVSENWQQIWVLGWWTGCIAPQLAYYFVSQQDALWQRVCLGVKKYLSLTERREGRLKSQLKIWIVKSSWWIWVQLSLCGHPGTKGGLISEILKLEKYLLKAPHPVLVCSRAFCGPCETVFPVVCFKPIAN